MTCNRDMCESGPGFSIIGAFFTFLFAVFCALRQQEAMGEKPEKWNR